MGKYYLVTEDGSQLVSGNEKPTGSPDENYVTKEEELAFIGYLREKDDVMIEARTEERGLLNHYIFDYEPIEREILELIKSAENEEDAYNLLAGKISKLNPRWQDFPICGAWMEEDVIEYLLLLGYDIDDAKKITFAVGNRGFKNTDWIKDKRLPDSFKIWACSSTGFLRSRAYITDLFRKEYALFHKRKESLGKFGGYIPSGAAVIVFRDDEKQVNTEKLAEIAASMYECGIGEVTVKNLNSDNSEIIAKKETASDDEK